MSNLQKQPLDSSMLLCKVPMGNVVGGCITRLTTEKTPAQINFSSTSVVFERRKKSSFPSTNAQEQPAQSNTISTSLGVIALCMHPSTCHLDRWNLLWTCRNITGRGWWSGNNIRRKKSSEIIDIVNFAHTSVCGLFQVIKNTNLLV